MVRDMLEGGGGPRAHTHGEGEGGEGCPACGATDLDAEPAAKVGRGALLMTMHPRMRPLRGAWGACAPPHLMRWPSRVRGTPCMHALPAHACTEP